MLPITLGNIFDDYFKHLQRLNRSSKTIANRISALGIFQKWLDENEITIKDVSFTDLECFQTWIAQEYQPRGKPVSSRTVNSYVTIIKSFYEFLANENLILSDPSENLQHPKKPKKIHRDILSIAELKRLLQAPDNNTASGLRDIAAMRLMALSGLRAGDVCKINLKNVNLKKREIIIRQGKGKRDRLAFIDRNTVHHLARYLVQARPNLITSKKNTAFIVDDKGLRIRAGQLRTIIAIYTKKAKIRKHLTCHSLRRTFCTQLLQAGASLKIVAECAGHSLSTSATYTKLDISELSSVYRQAHPRSQL